MRRSIKNKLFNWLMDYLYLGVVIFAAYVWLKTTNWHAALAVFIVGVLFLVAGVPLIENFFSKKKFRRKNLFTQRDIRGEICPRCGNHLIVRVGKKGDFLGCTSFPKCRFTKNI